GNLHRHHARASANFPHVTQRTNLSGKYPKTPTRKTNTAGQTSINSENLPRCPNSGQVGLDGVAGAVIDRPGGQVVFGHPEGLLDTPQLVISADDELCGLAGLVGGVALPSRQRANLGL